jgi:hypothetical protein
MHRKQKIGSARTLFVVMSCFFWAKPAWADPLIDLSMFNPPMPENRKIAEPTMEWLVHPQASSYCVRVPVKDGFVSRPESCVYWKLSDKKCVVVTTASTSHSELGHLFVACLKGGAQP